MIVATQAPTRNAWGTDRAGLGCTERFRQLVTRHQCSSLSGRTQTLMNATKQIDSSELPSNLPNTTRKKGRHEGRSRTRRAPCQRIKLKPFTNTMPDTRRKVCLPATSSPDRSHRPPVRPICTKLSICTLYNLAATVAAAAADAATATTVNFGYIRSLARSLPPSQHSRPLAPSRARSLPSCRPSCGKPCRYRREATGWLATD